MWHMHAPGASCSLSYKNRILKPSCWTEGTEQEGVIQDVGTLRACQPWCCLVWKEVVSFISIVHLWFSYSIKCTSTLPSPCLYCSDKNVSFVTAPFPGGMEGPDRARLVKEWGSTDHSSCRNLSRTWVCCRNITFGHWKYGWVSVSVENIWWLVYQNEDGFHKTSRQISAGCRKDVVFMWYISIPMT